MSAGNKTLHVHVYGSIDNHKVWGVAIYTCMALVLILTSESLVVRAQLHLLIMLRKHLDNNLNSITEEGKGQGGKREGERESRKGERGREGGGEREN